MISPSPTQTYLKINQPFEQGLICDILVSAQATLASSSRKLEQITADYRQKLQAERADNSDKIDKTQAGSWGQV